MGVSPLSSIALISKPSKNLLCCVVEVYYSNVVVSRECVLHTNIVKVYYTTVVEVYYITDYIRYDIGSISENGSSGITNSNP